MSKLTEQVALDQFNDHCDSFSLLPDFQSAYRKNYRSETALVKIVNNALLAMEHQKVTALIIPDLLAAFNTVDFDILPDILRCKFGITGTALNWYKSYLTPRHMKVSIKICYSEPRQLKYHKGRAVEPIFLPVIAVPFRK